MARYKSIDQVNAEIIIAVRESVAAALVNISEQLTKEIEKKFKKISSNYTGYRKYQQEANEEIAKLMREAVVEAYDSELELHRQFRNAPEYRVGSGRIGGSALRTALGSTKMG